MKDRKEFSFNLESTQTTKEKNSEKNWTFYTIIKTINILKIIVLKYKILNHLFGFNRLSYENFKFFIYLNKYNY